jgi:hypothetical protein
MICFNYAIWPPNLVECKNGENVLGQRPNADEQLDKAQPEGQLGVEVTVAEQLGVLVANHNVPTLHHHSQQASMSLYPLTNSAEDNKNTQNVDLKNGQ